MVQTRQDSPLVSVLLPVYNAEEYLRSAIDSILQQTYKNFELLIVNDCSTDGSLQIAQEYAQKDPRIVLVSNSENLKLARSLNKAIGLAKGKYLARMDADDISFSQRLEKQVEFMEGFPQVVVCGCDMDIVDKKGRQIGFRKYYVTDAEIREKLFFFSPFSHPTIIIRKAALDQVGGYEHDYNPAEDYELYFRLGTVGEFRNLPETLFAYRIVSSSMTQGSTLRMEQKTIEIREKYSQHSHYHMSVAAKAYNQLHKLSLRLFSPEFRMKAFTFVRTKLHSEKGDEKS